VSSAQCGWQEPFFPVIELIPGTKNPRFHVERARVDCRLFPKIELHLHLDCSLSFEVVSTLAPEVTLQEYRERYIAPSKCTSLADFLTRAPRGIKLMQTEEHLRLVTDDLFKQLLQDHVLYAEIRFAPLLHVDNGLTPDQVVGIVEEATAKAVEKTGVEARVILCTLRHFNESQSMETVRLVDRFRGTRVAGFDIAADEAGYPIDQHIPAFQYAFIHRIPCTAHAGEARGAESVWETLKHFRPARIGHGVRSLEDMNLIAHLREERIHLEICPSCNIQIDIFDDYRDHPIDTLYRLGLSVGVNTDARTITNVTLTDEYDRLHRAFGWTQEHFFRCNKNALLASFVPDDVKQRLLERLTHEYHALSS
jgi:adenosine deaminase